MLPQQYCLRWKYHHSNLQTMFSQLLDRGCFCDVTLACEGQLIRAHRVVLCACSSFFDTVLTNYASERDPIIIMKDVTFADVKCLIEFMYKGEINVEHANLASLLKTADDLKIKGLAEVSWRDDEDGGGGPPIPSAVTEFHSPTQLHEMYAASQRVGSPALFDHHHQQQQQLQQQQQQHSQHYQRERKLSSPKAGGHSQSQRLPTLTPIPPMATAAAVAAAAAAVSPVENYLGPKRKRGRPPLDDAYDVFNVRKLTQYGNHLDAHHLHHQQQQQQQQAYLEAQRHYNDEQRRLAVISPIPQSSSASAAVAAAYHQHIQQQQHNKRMRELQRHQEQQQHHSNHQQPHHHQTEDEMEPDEGQADPDPEWITSNLEVNISSGGDSESALDCGAETNFRKEHKADITDEKEELNGEVKIEARKRRERSAEKFEENPQQLRERSNSSRKRSNAEEREDIDAEKIDREAAEQQSQERHARSGTNEEEKARAVLDGEIEKDDAAVEGASEEVEKKKKVSNGTVVPQPVEDMEKTRSSRSPSNHTPTTTKNNNNHSSSNLRKRASSGANDQNHTPPPHTPPSTSASLHHTPPSHAYGKYVPEGYILNEHGMLMTHDFVHPPLTPISAASASASSIGAIGGAAAATALANGNDGEYADIKMEEYDGTEMRLTSEEMSEWQDVIKMDDYLAKGRRPQFWEEPFTRRVLDAIKNKRLEMKKASRILGVSYGTLYGRYREVYGCLKHPYSSANFRPTQANQLAVQPRFDMVWPTSKRDSAAHMPGQMEIGKIRPKDLSELWTRPQI